MKFIKSNLYFFLCILGLFFIFLQISNIYAEEEIIVNSKEIYNINISQVLIDENNRYYFTLSIENLNINAQNNYNIELNYPENNLNLYSENFTCLELCYKKLYIDEVFFGKYEIKLNYFNETETFENKFYFNLDAPDANYNLKIDPIYYISNGQIKITGDIVLNSANEVASIFELEIFPKSAPKEKNVFQLSCSKNCTFEEIISTPILIDEYIVRIYSMQGDLERYFKTIYNIVSPIPSEKIVENLVGNVNIKIADKEKNGQDDDEKINEKNKLKTEFNIYHEKNNGKDTAGYFLYDNIGKKKDKDVKVKFKKNNFEVNSNQILTSDNYDVEFEFNETSKVKRIKVPNTKLENLSIGVEDVKSNSIVGVPESVVSAFAINPILPSPIGFFEVNFTATGTSLYKCELYNFSTQTCFGSYKYLMDTIPGQDYIINLTGVDPLFVNTVANTSNDGRAAAGVFQLNTAPVRFGNVAGVAYDAYFRFDKVSVPAGSTIRNAYLNLSSAATRTTLTTNAKIYGLKEVNCIHFDAPNGGNNPVDNIRTGNFSLWNNVPAWTNAENGPDTKSTNISLIIQEIIDLPSWEVNNSICIALLNNGSTNNAYRDVRTVGAVNPAKLYVDYADPLSYVMWLPISKTLLSYAGGSSNSIVNVTSIMNNTNVSITELGGSGASFISVNMTSLGNLINNQKVQVLFDCSPSISQSIGSYESIFNVKSNQSQSGTNITVNCIVSSAPQLNLIQPSTINYVNVTEGQNLILKFNITSTNGNLITNFTDVLNVTLGNIKLNISNYSNLVFNSNFSISSQMTTPQGMSVYGNKMWITSGDKDSVYMYYTNGTFITYYNLSAMTTDPIGITTLDGSEFWVVDNGAVAPNDVVIHYDSNFNYIDSFSIAAQTTTPWGIAFDGTTFYVEDDNLNRVLRYNRSGAYQSTFSIATYTTSPRGISVYGNEIWIVDDVGTAPNDLLLHFYINGTYIDAFSVAAQTTLPIGISTINGKQFFVADTTSDRVLLYKSQNTKYNISENSFEVNVTIPYGLSDFQNLSIFANVYPDNEFILNDFEINALNFGEKTPPSTITNLQNITQRINWIYFNWTNPLDIDFSHTQIWFNNSNIANITNPNNFYNLTGLLVNTNYTLSTRTVDINGNINTTWVNKTASTTSYPVIQNITPLNNTNFNQSQIITISANVTSQYGINNVTVNILWESGAETLTMINQGNNLYRVNFTNTLDFSTYNFSITAIDNLSASITSTGNIFNIISNTPFLDTYVRSDTPTTNYGAATRVMVSSVPTSIRRGLLRFDLSYLPTGVRIDNSMMQLYLATYGGTPIFHSIFAVNSTWINTVTWNTQPGIYLTNWNSTRVSAIGWQYFNITNLTKNWYNGSIINNGLMIREATEVTTGTHQYRSANAGTLIPTLIINYTDITNPQVSNINAIENNYHVKDVIPIRVLVTDNIGVSSVWANISWLNGSQKVNLVLVGSFQYAVNFTNLTNLGEHNITIYANDTTNLINNTLKFYFNVSYIDLEFKKEITRFSNNSFNINLTLKNKNFFQTPENKNLTLHIFIPNEFSIISIFLADSYFTYNAIESDLYLPSKNGTIYKFNLIPSTQGGFVFDKYLTEHNLSNSWSLSFDILGSGEYDISKIKVGFE